MCIYTHTHTHCTNLLSQLWNATLISGLWSIGFVTASAAQCRNRLHHFVSFASCSIHLRYCTRLMMLINRRVMNNRDGECVRSQTMQMSSALLQFVNENKIKKNHAHLCRHVHIIIVASPPCRAWQHDHISRQSTRNFHFRFFSRAGTLGHASLHSRNRRWRRTSLSKILLHFFARRKLLRSVGNLSRSSN